MGGLKKGKGGHKSKTGKGRDGTGKGKEFKRQQDEWQVEIQGPPQERIAAAKPFWEGLTQEQRVEILTISIDDLRNRAKEITERLRKQAAAEEAEFAAEHPHTAITGIKLEASLEDTLEEGIKRLKEKGTWKLWKWPRTGEEFYDAEAFRQWVDQELLEEPLRKLLPRDEGKPVEKPAEAGLRLRMTELLHKVQHDTRQLQEEMVCPKRGGRGQRATPDQLHTAVRDTNIELITVMLESLEKEHELLYQLVLFPVTNFVCELLNSSVGRESNRTELFYDDLEKLPQEEVARICEWLQEKVDGFGSKLKPEAKDLEEQEEEETIGDVDLFALTEDKSALTVNAKWLQHLQERLLGEDGHPRKAVDGEDPFRMGLVLEWVYGTIVSTAEKARDGAKRPLGGRTPNAMQAYDQLVQALRDQQQWEQRAKTAKDLLNEMLASRKEADRLREQGYDIRPIVPPEEGPAPDLPDSVIVDLLKREVLLTGAKLHALWYDHVVAERKLRTLKAQLRQGEPEFERLKRELEEMKNQPRGLEGTYRTQAEMERHRAQLADQAIEEQLEVQTAFREHGNRLQKIYEAKQRTEVEMARREQEIKQLNGWKSTVQSVIERFKELPESPNDEGILVEDATSASLRNALAEQNPGEKLRTHFQKDVRRQLYTLEDDVTFFDWIKNELKSVEKRLEDGRAVLQHMEMFLISVACDDPGATIGVQLALPLLQERLDAKAMEYKDKRAGEAAHELFLEEEMRKQREKAEKERRQKQKLKLKEKVRSEKERLAAEKEAREQAERDSQEREERRRAEQEEAERMRKLEEMERLRKEEEDALEARRKVLCSNDSAADSSGEQQVVAEESPPESWTEVDAADAHSSSSGVKVHEEADLQGNGQPAQRWGPPYNRRRLYPNETPSVQNPHDRGSGSRSHGRSLNPQPKAIPIRRADRESTRAVPITSIPNGPRFQKQGQEPPGSKVGTNGFRKDIFGEHRPPLGVSKQVKEGEKLKQTSPPPVAAKAQVVEAGPELMGDKHAGAPPPDNFVDQVNAVQDAFGGSQGEPKPDSHPLAWQSGRPQANGGVTNVASDSGWQRGQGMVPQVQFGAVVPPTREVPGVARDVPNLPAALTAEASTNSVTDAGTVSSQPPSSVLPGKTDPLGSRHAVGQDRQTHSMSADVAFIDPENDIVKRPSSRSLSSAGLMATPSKGHTLTSGQVGPPLSSPSPGSHVRNSPMAVPVGTVGMLAEGPGNQTRSAAVVPGKSAGGVSELLETSDEQGHVYAGRNGTRAHGHRPRSIPGPQDPVVKQPNGILDLPARAPQLFPNNTPNGLLIHEQAKTATSPAVGPPIQFRPDHSAGVGEAGDPGGAMVMSHHAQLRGALHPQQYSGSVKGYGQAGLVPRGLPIPPGARTIDAPQGMAVPSATPDMQTGSGLLPSQGLPQSSNHFGRHRHMHMPSRVQGQNGHVQPVAMSTAGGPVGGMPVPPSYGFPMQPGNQGPYVGPHRGLHLGANHQMHPSFSGRPPLGSNSAVGSPTQGNQSVRMSQQFFPGMGPTSIVTNQPSGPPGTPNRDPFMHGLQGNAAVTPQHLPNHVMGMHMVQQRVASGRSFVGGSNATLPSPPVHAGVGVGMPLGNAPPYSPAMAFAGPVPGGSGPGIVKHSFQSSGRGSTPPSRRSGSGRGFSLRYDAQEFVPSHGSARGSHGKTNPRQHELMGGMDHSGRDSGPLAMADSHFRRGSATAGMPFKDPADAHVAVAAYMPRASSRPEVPVGHSLESMERKVSGGLAPLTNERLGMEGNDPAVSNPGVVEQHSSQFHLAPQSSSASPSANTMQLPHVSRGLSSNWVGASSPEGISRGVSKPTMAYMELSNSDLAEETGVCTPDDGRPTSSSQEASQPPSQVSSAAATEGSKEVSFSAEGSLALQRVSSTGTPAVVTSMPIVADGAEKRKPAKGPADLKNLRLVRGLRNEAGYNNCFLNVVIQSLWHLRTFRRGLLALDPQELIAGGRPQEDLNVLIALRDIFVAFSQPLNVMAESTQLVKSAPSAEGAESDAESQSAVGSVSTAGDLSVSPKELRKALSSLNTAVHFNESDMHDASEVLGEIFGSLHRAESGILHPGALDPLLPHIVRLPVALANGRAAAPLPSAQSKAMSLVHRLFGLEVQVPTRSEEEDMTVPNKRPKANGGWQEQTSRSSSRNQLQALGSAAQAQNKRTKDPNFVEVQQFMTFFHLVPAQGLRLAHDRKVGEFEVMLQMACRADSPSQGVGSTQPGSGLLDINLLRMPAVLTLAVVWDSPQAAADAIRSTVHALKTELHISKVFKGVPSSSGAYRLRCVICYLRHHYQAYALSEEMDQWLLFDDTNIKYVGEWENVVASMIASRHQPSVLFFERPLL